MMRVLALDYGSARIGCAVSDPSGTLVRPVAVIERADVREVLRVAEELGAERVVVGLPLNMDGTEGAQAQATRAFCEQLGAVLSVPVETYDERLTTRMAQASRRAGAGAAEDSLAAAHLLEAYLASAGGTGAEDDDGA
jgi:putative Holliday junction resolvase